MTIPAVEGRVVLVAEDEYLIAMGLESLLCSSGATVRGPVATVAQAMRLVDRDVDVALLDVNLGGEMVFPVADRLVGLGVPVVFTTGYSRGDLPSRYAEVPLLPKPFKTALLRRTLDRLFAATIER